MNARWHGRCTQTHAGTSPFPPLLFHLSPMQENAMQMRKEEPPTCKWGTHICADKAKVCCYFFFVFLLIVPMQVTTTTGPSPHKDDMEESCMAMTMWPHCHGWYIFTCYTRSCHQVSLSKRWGTKIRWLVMHLANVCTVMARDRGIVQVIYHMTRHVTTRDIESTCVLLLVRDKGRV